MKKDRRPTSAISSQRASAKSDIDPFDEDETERKFLLSKPACFIIFGKPGSGKTTLARSLCRKWKCQFINSPNSIAQAIELQTELGKQAQEILIKGEVISEELTIQILRERLASKEVAHYGYILDDFPCTSEEYLSIDGQFEFIKKLPYNPDYIINLRIADEDLIKRRKGFRVDPLTNEVYSEERYDPPKVVEEDKVDEDEDDEDDDNMDEMDDEDEQSLQEEEDFSDPAEEEEMTPDLIERLIPRVDDFQENMEEEIKKFKDLLRRKILNYMGNHERQKVIELNATKPKVVLFKSLVQKLDSMSVPRSVEPLRLQGGEDQLDIPEDTETDDLLRTLAATETIAPGFRWRRSRWGRTCPVALYEGSFIQGSPQFAVSFLDKLYVMSSLEASEKFMRNPRPYILSPQPRNPVKLCVVGPPLSGKTTLANHIAKKYGAKVIDVEAMLTPRREAQTAKMMDDVRAEALESAIPKVTAILQQERLAAEQERLAAEQARIAAENEQEKSEDEGGEADGALKEKDEEAEKGDGNEEQQGDDQEGKDGEDEEVKPQADDDEDDGEEDEEGESEEVSREASPGNSEDVVADENHPQVIKMVEEALDEARKKDFSLSADECLEMVEAAIVEHHNEMQANDLTGQLAGNWILDNFPQTREQFNLMVERGLLPNNLICLKDNSDGGSFLLKRWHKLQIGESTHNIMPEEAANQRSEITLKSGESSNNNLSESAVSMESDYDRPPKSPELEAQRSSLTNFDKNWTSLQSVIRSVSVLEPLLIDCAQEEQKLWDEAIRDLEAPFQYKGWEYTGMDQDEEEEDLAAEETDNYDDDDDEEEEVDVFNKDKRKRFGDTRQFCPVALKENNVLWPGSSECAVKYREKVFYFSSPEARVKFLDDTTAYLADKEPLKPPALRLIILGAKGSGKTLIGKEIAKKFGVFHISFKDRLQELIIAKTKKRIGPDYPEEEDEPDENEAEESGEKSDQKESEKDVTSGKASPKEEEGEGEKRKKEEAEDENKIEEEEEEEVEVEFSEIETNIRDNIMDNEPLTNTTLESIIPAWWNEEPFKSTGFILEGFPRNAEETRFLVESGFYPDCVINMATEEDDVVGRLMPPLLEKWKKKRDKKLARKQKQLDVKMKKREVEKNRRKEERLKQITQRKANRRFSRADSQNSNEDSDDEPEDDDDDEDEDDGIEDLDEIIEAEMAEEEEEEEEDDEEETEEDATERIKVELAEKYDEETEYTSSILESLAEEYMIPIVEVGAGRKAKIVQFVIEKKLKPIVEHRDALFDRSQPIAPSLAKKMLIQGYKQPSKFGKWCPVQLSEGNVLPPNDTPSSPLFPVVYRQHVYFFASEHNREQFILSPFKYIHQAPPKPIIPIRLAIVGPPKSGKTTLANRFAQEYGVVRISAGEALRKVTMFQSSTALAEQILEFLKAGEAVPDELVAHAIDISLLDMQCQMRGYVLDGYPATARQIQFLTDRSIIPYKVIELKVESKELFMRGSLDRSSPQRVFPLHDSHMIIAVKLSAYLNSIGPIRSWYQGQHRNLFELNGEESKWKVWNGALQETKIIIKKIQTYLERTAQDKAASIADLCVTPSQLRSRFGIFGHYCPVNFVDKGEFADCETDETQKFAAEFRGHYYKMWSEKEIGIFLENPERYTPPHVDKKFPPPELLPRKLTGADVKTMFPVQIEMLGYCPVTYLDGDLRYESLVPGDPELVAKYKEKLYLFASEMTRDKFMRLPEKYATLKLPSKLPPKRDPISITGLPMLGFMEQTLEVAIRKAATAVGCVKPKFPFLSAKQSALLYMAYHLKANNPKAKEYTRTKYKKKLMKFEAQCELIQYLGRTMTRKYKEPEDRPIDFDNKLTTFMSLGGVPASGNAS